MSGGHHANDGTASRIRRALARQAGPPLDLAPALLAVASQQARCTRGEHDKTEARKGYVTYVRGRQVPPGTRYCQFCSAILTDPDAAPVAGEE